MFYSEYFSEFIKIFKELNFKKFDEVVDLLINCKKRNGRLFILGVGGSAGNASHAVNDFRKLCQIESYTPVDNISEITAKTNDDGFDKIFDSYLKLNKLSINDIILIFSVGGGSLERKISVNLINAIKFAKRKKTKIISIIGKKGYAFKKSDISILINVKSGKFVTPISESMQTVIWHMLVTHPKLQVKKTKW